MVKGYFRCTDNNEVNVFRKEIKMESILLPGNQRIIIMVISSLSNDEAESLYKKPKLITTGTHRWVPRGSLENPVSFYLEIEVITEDKKTELAVRAWKGLTRKKRYSFSLLNKDKTPIRRWDDKIGDPHPYEKQETAGPHKHFWTEEHKDRAWYPTTDVRTNDPDGAILDFMKECNIETKHFHIQKDTGSAYA
jgi:hypothetical protein